MLCMQLLLLDSYGQYTACSLSFTVVCRRWHAGPLRYELASRRRPRWKIIGRMACEHVCTLIIARRNNS